MAQSQEKMSWRRFRDMMRYQQTTGQARKTPSPEQNKSQNNNQSVVERSQPPPKKKLDLRKAVQLQIEQSRQFSQNRNGHHQPKPERQPGKSVLQTEDYPYPEGQRKSITPKPKPKKKVDFQKAVQMQIEQSRQFAQNRKTHQQKKPERQPGRPAMQNPNSISKDIPVIFYTKEPQPKQELRESPRQQKSKPDKTHNNVQSQPPITNESTKISKSWNSVIAEQINQSKTFGAKKREAYEERSVPISKQKQNKSQNNMPPKSKKTVVKGKSSTQKNESMEYKRRKYLHRIAKQKPKQVSWKDADSRARQRRDSEGGNDLTNLYSYKPREPEIVDPYEKYVRATERPRGRQPREVHQASNVPRSRSYSPNKKPTQSKGGPKRSRSVSPVKKSNASPERRQKKEELRNIPKVKRFIDETGKQHIIVEKEEVKTELYKGKYPNYLRHDRPVINFKRKRLQRPEVAQSLPVTEKERRVWTRKMPPVQFTKDVYHNYDYEEKLRRRKWADMGIDDDFYAHHNGDYQPHEPVIRSHGGRDGTFYHHHPKEDSPINANRGKVSQIDVSRLPLTKPKTRPNQLYGDQDGIAVEYDEGYEIYKDKYPNYLRHQGWKSVPLRLQAPLEPQESDEESPRDNPVKQSTRPPPNDHKSDGFRHKRDLGTHSPRRDIVLGAKASELEPKSRTDSGVGSHSDMPTPRRSGPAQQTSLQHTDIMEDEDDEGYQKSPREIPDVLQNLMKSIPTKDPVFLTQEEDTETRVLPAEPQDVSQFARSHSDLDHASWQRYSISRNDTIAAVIKCPKSVLQETQSSLIYEDRLPTNIHPHLPQLPYMEFEDSDSDAQISPMRLSWANSQDRRMSSSIYLALPIHSEFYNDVLQQLLFLYTDDLKEWKYTEGKLTNITFDGMKYDFIEVYIEEPFQFIIFDVKVRYREDVGTIMPNGGQLESQMEKGVRVEVKARTFDKPAKMKIKVEPLDMNETDIRNLVPSMHGTHAVAVSPIVKVATSEPMRQSVSIFVPKPGQATFGSVRIGLRGKLTELKNLRVHLLTKDKEVQRFTSAATLKRELARELEFQIRIWKYGGKCYCLLVLEGLETIGPGISSDYTLTSHLPDRGGDFLNNVLMKQMALEMTYDDLQLRSLGKLLLNSSTANMIIDQHPDNIEMAMFKIIRRWKNQNKKVSDAMLTRRLIIALRDCGLKQEAAIIREKYESHMTGNERNTILTVFDELKACPSVLVNWKLFAKYLGLSQENINAAELKQEEPNDIRRRCSKMLKKTFEKFEKEEEFYRDILLRYTRALGQIGCERIAASIEKRHIDKFYVNPV